MWSSFTIVATLLTFRHWHCASGLPKPYVTADKLTKSVKKDTSSCTKLIIGGKGDFRVQKKIYPVRIARHYIESLQLLKRTSFYKCEPRDEKYGISPDGHSWWVDKGCEAIFEVQECPNNGHVPTSESWRPVQEELDKRLATATLNVDIASLNLDGVERRFEYPILK